MLKALNKLDIKVQFFLVSSLCDFISNMQSPVVRYVVRQSSGIQYDSAEHNTLEASLLKHHLSTFLNPL